MKLYKVRVRRWHGLGERLREGVWSDEKVLLEADSMDLASVAGFEWAMGVKFFGVPLAQCQVMEVASVVLPLAL